VVLLQRRNTNQRKVIYEILKSTDIHPTADWIYERARKIMPNISLGTVYRNLKILKDEGLILELNDGKQSRFDARTDNHLHFKCEMCNSIYDIDFNAISLQINDKILDVFNVKSVDIVLNGICPKCIGDEREKDN
jgi:Fur family ferric uptake transcriptional regulator/Fur family peroxide stress response transcriptional regulator